MDNIHPDPKRIADACRLLEEIEIQFGITNAKEFWTWYFSLLDAAHDLKEAKERIAELEARSKTACVSCGRAPAIKRCASCWENESIKCRTKE